MDNYSNIEDFEDGQLLHGKDNNEKLDPLCELNAAPEDIETDTKLNSREGFDHGRNSPDNLALELSIELGSESDICEEAEQKIQQQKLDEDLSTEMLKKSPIENVEGDESSAEEGQLSPLRDHERQESTCKETKDDGELSDDEDIEEGEVKDSNLLPTHQPRRICHFFNRGNCTWGNQCRFLHLSVNDRGFYNMFSSNHNSFATYSMPGNRTVPRSIPTPRFFPFRGSANRGKFRIPPDKVNHSVETSWDRGLQSVKEEMQFIMEKKDEELYYEEKTLHVDESEEVEHDKENFRNGNSPDQEEYDDLNTHDYEQRNVYHKKHQSGSSKSGTDQLKYHREYKTDGWQERENFEVQISRAHAYEWKDAWQRSKSPRRSRKRKLSSCSSTSCDSHSTHSSRSSYRSTHTSYSSSRSSSSDSSYHSRGKISRRSTSNPRTTFHKSRSASKHSNKSLSRSRSRSLSSLSLSSISSTSDYSKNYDSHSSRKDAQPQSSHKSNVQRQPVTRTLYEEMQRLRNEQLKEKQADNSAKRSSSNNPKPSKKGHKTVKKEALPVENEKVTVKRMKSINNRRDELLEQLKMLDDAINKKRAKQS